MLSFGIDAARAFSIAFCSARLPAGSGPPSFAATISARVSFVNSWPRFASAAPFLCLIDFHLLCPDTGANCSDGSSLQPLRQVGPAAVRRPAGSGAVVERVADRRVGPELEQKVDRFLLSGLGGEMEGRDALPVRRPAEGADPVDVGTELDQAADGCDAPVRRRPGERSAAVGVGLDVRP